MDERILRECRLAVEKFDEFVAYAKANPGKIKFGAGGLAAAPQLNAESMAFESGIKITHIPMDSDSAIMASLLGGHIQAACTGWTGFGEHAKAGKLRLLVVFSDQRLPEFPDIPTAKELNLQGGTRGPIGILGSWDRKAFLGTR